MEINIVDAIMGAGKSQSAINFMNEADDSKKFIYITPYTDEVDRIVAACTSKHFKQPIKYNEKAPKILSFKDLLNKGTNIATTHALFHLFDDEIIDLCYSQNYTLIMDEVTDVVEPYYIEKTDLELLLENLVTVEENGLLKWRTDQLNYNGSKFDQEKRLCEIGCLAMYGNSLMLWMFPVKIFRAFRESYILTYMFHAQMQKYYYDFYGLKYKYLYIEGNSLDTYRFTETKQTYKHKYDYRKLVTIFDDKKLNMIGDAETALSKGWYERNKNNILIKQLKNNTFNYFTNKLTVYDNGNWIKSNSDNNLWTTFKDYQKQVSGKGYAKGYIPSNLRATNEYRNRTTAAYLVNKYFNPLIKRFFEKNGVEVNEDDYAVSEMLQWIWRTGIRDGKHITVYIPSRRMRELLISWIDTQEYECTGIKNTNQNNIF